MKKNILFSALVAVVASAFVSCQQERVDPNPEKEKGELHFVVKARQEVPTRTYLTDNGDGTYTPYWKHADVLGAFLSSTSIDKNKKAVDLTLTNTAADGASGVFEGTAVAEGSGTFLAFYPKAAFEKGYDGGGIGLNIGATTDYIQHPAVGSPDPACDILVGKACEYISDGDVVAIDDLLFTRPLSVLKINLKGSFAQGEEVSWFKMEASSGTLSGRVSIDLTTAGIITWTASKPYAWAEYTSSKPVINVDGQNTVYFVVNPTTLTSGTTVTFTAETSLHMVQKEVTLSSDMSFPRAGIAVINLSVNESDCSEKELTGQYGLIEEEGAFEDGGQYLFIMPDGATPSTYYALHTYRTLELSGLTPVDDIISNPADKYIFIAEAGTESGKIALKNKSTEMYYPSNPTSTTTAGSSEAQNIALDFLPESGAYKMNLGSRFAAYFEATNGDTDIRYYTSGFEDQLAASKALTSQKSGAFKVYKLNYSPKTRIDTPTGLTVSGMVLSWNAVTGAASYNVKIGETTVQNVTGTSYTFTGTPDYYDVSVVAVPSNTTLNKNSLAAKLTGAKFGTPVIATPVLASGGVTSSAVTATWTDDPHATNGYHCELFLGETKQTEKEVALGVQSVTFDGLTGNTEYTVKVKGNAVTGTQAYEASAFASINLTPVGLHIEDITAAGSYAVEGLSVMAVNGRNIIASDATGSILVYAAKDHGYVVNDVINVNGSVIDYNGVWEFTGPTITKTGTTAVIYPEPVEYDAAKIDAYADAPVIEYATATGVADSEARTVTVASGKVLNVYGSLADVDGRTVSINGYAFGYNNSKVNFMLVGTPTIDQSVPYLGTNPDNGQTIQWDNDKYGTANAETITVSLNSAASGYTVSFTDTANAWTVSDNGEGTITVYPKAANTSTTADKTLDLVITHKDDGDVTSTITLKQNKQTNSGPKTSTLTFTKACGGSGTATDGAKWTVTSDGTESSFDNTKGIHYGTSSAQVQYIRLSTSDITGTITSIVVNASTASGVVSATVGVTVGGAAFGGAAKSLTSSAADYTFTGSASGEIVVTVTKPSKASKALYVKSIIVTYN